MIVEERLTTYLHSLESADIPVLDEIEQEALADMVPIIRKETKSFLKVMLEIKRPVKILEIGTAVGFSAILMGKYSPEECHITTIENYEKRIPIARANFARAGMEQKITLLEGDALEIMKGMPDDAGFDFVFMDAAKGQYPAYLEQVMRFLVPGGILITDNVLQDGDIIDFDAAGGQINCLTSLEGRVANVPDLEEQEQTFGRWLFRTCRENVSEASSGATFLFKQI